jgi:hypothetical protein
LGVRHSFQRKLWLGILDVLNLKKGEKVRDYYRAPTDPFRPMVFFNNTYWTRTLPATRLLKSLFVRNNRAKDFKDYVLTTSDEAEAVKFILSKAPPPKTHLHRLKNLGLLT